MIELTAARLAAKRRSEADLQAMSDAIDTYARIESADDIEGRVDADIAFHAAMIQAARNRILVTMLESISGMVRDHRIQYILRSVKEERDMVVDEHRGILAAVASANEQEAVRRVRRHMRLVWTQVRQRVDHPEARSPFEDDFLAAVDDPSST
jgi:DNA-binding FadR family transcriptional regulator